MTSLPSPPFPAPSIPPSLLLPPQSPPPPGPPPSAPPSPFPSLSSSVTIRLLHRYLPPSLSPTLSTLHSHAKGWLYFGLTTALLVLALSNSFSRLFRSIWSDVGNHWAVIWSTVLSLHLPPPVLYIAGSALLHFFIYWSYSLALACLDLHPTPHLFSRYKIQPHKNTPVPLPLVLRCVRQVLFNQFFVAVPTLAVTYPLALWRGVGFDLPLPSFERFCSDMAVCILVEELLFYYTHRALHHPALYGRVHKQHHEWTAPIALATNYCSPTEHLLSNLIPALTGPLLCASHLSVIWVWQAIATLTSVNTHSGYHLPFMPSPEAHDFHHLRFTQNFGVLGLLDWLHGTDETFRHSTQYEHHKTYFSVGGYEPGLVYLRRRLGTMEGVGDAVARARGAGGVEGEWVVQKKKGVAKGKEDEKMEVKEASGMGLGLGLDCVQADSEL